MFKRFQARPLVLTIVAFLSGSIIASAEPLPPNLQNVPDLPLSGLQLLNAGLFGPTDVDPTSLVVTDEQLASSGMLDVPQALVDDPSMVVVDDDKVQCPNAAFTTINAAVAAASPGATIRVCPGIYKESVRILKPGLVLQAPRQQGEATECKTPGDPDPTREAILEYDAGLNGGNPSVGFQLEAPNIVIDGFVIQPDTTKVASNGVGIFTVPIFAGYDIRHNVVQRNTFGVYINSSGVDANGDPSRSFVRQNCIRNNTFSGVNEGVGIYSDQGLHLANLENNFLTGHDSAAIIIDTFNTTPSNVQVTHNESVNDGAIGIFDSTLMTIDYNKVTNSVGSGIVLFNVDSSEVAFNNLQTGVNNGIRLALASTIFVKSNKVANFKLNGVRIGNGSNNNTVETNNVQGNTLAGMRVRESSSNNTFRNNKMTLNTPDCSDNTVGTGTAGTANFWINDFGATEDRAGICKHASP